MRNQAWPGVQLSVGSLQGGMDPPQRAEPPSVSTPGVWAVFTLSLLSSISAACRGLGEKLQRLHQREHAL